PSKPASLAQATELLRPFARLKERSYETSRSSHHPLLSVSEHKEVVVLLGDSMIERMISTARSPSLAPWPSTCMFPDTVAQTVYPDTPLHRRSDVFNAGVGGDKFENIAYRLAGDDASARPLPSLLEALSARTVRLWVVQAGTNNLHPKKGLRERDYSALRALLASLLLVSPVQTQILLTGLFYRKDVADSLVDQANAEYERLTTEFNQEHSRVRIVYLAPAEAVDPSRHLVDHVHLSEEGYRLW
ncbi:hypothetical protein GQ53DRAFT_608136, partial [Thozetella sp. PMI_491]